MCIGQFKYFADLRTITNDNEDTLSIDFDISSKF